MFQAVCPGGFLPVCKATCKATCRATYQLESLAARLVVWEVGCLGDQVDPVPNNFHQTRVQGLAICKGFLTNNILLTPVTHRFNHPDRRVYLRRLEWGTQVQRQHNQCWPSKTDRWKPSKDGTLKKGNSEREVA